MLIAVSGADPALARVFQGAGWYITGEGFGTDKRTEEGPFSDKDTCERRLSEYNLDEAAQMMLFF